MKPRCIAFDFDGIIATTLGEMHLIYNEMAADFGFRAVDAEEIASMRHLTMKELLRNLASPSSRSPNCSLGDCAPSTPALKRLR